MSSPKMSVLVPAARLPLGRLCGVYAALVGGAAAELAISIRDPVLLAGFPLAVSMMRLAWGVAFVSSILTMRRRSTRWQPEAA